MGKTRLAADARGGARRARAARRAVQGRTRALRAAREALRDAPARAPRRLDDLGPLRGHLALLLPELGEPAAGSRPRDAVRGAARRARGDAAGTALVRARRPAVERRGDARGAGGARRAARRVPLLVVGVYRSDGLPREHVLRRLRHELRRAAASRSSCSRRSTPGETAALLAQRARRARPRRRSRARSTTAPRASRSSSRSSPPRCCVSGALAPGRRGLELAGGGEVPLPDTVRDAVLIGAAELLGRGRAAARGRGRRRASASTSASSPSSPSDDGVTELIGRGSCASRAGSGAFRHALTREALYADLPWMCRGARCTARWPRRSSGAGPRSREVAPHWLGARDDGACPRRRCCARRPSRGRSTPTATPPAPAGRRSSCGRRARTTRRRPALEDYAALLPARGRAGRGRARVARARSRPPATTPRRRQGAAAPRRGARAARATGTPRRGAARRRRGVRGDRPSRPRPRWSGSRSPTSAGWPRATARRSSSPRGARPTPTAPAASTCASARSASRAWRAPSAATTPPAWTIVRDGLALALEHDLTAVAAELYQRLSVTLYDSADYRRAEEALDTALELCGTSGDDRTPRSPA